MLYTKQKPSQSRNTTGIDEAKELKKECTFTIFFLGNTCGKDTGGRMHTRDEITKKLEGGPDRIM